MSNKIEKMEKQLEYEKVKIAKMGMELKVTKLEQEIAKMMEEIVASEKRLEEISKILD